MKIIPKLSAAIIALAMCVLLGTTAWAANSNGVTYTATLDKQMPLCVSDGVQTIELVIQTNKVVEIDSLEAMIDLPTDWEVKSLSGFAEFTDADVNVDNKIAWYSANTENLSVNVLLEVTIEIPANADAGEYQVGVKGIKLSSDYGTPWETGASAYTTVTIQDHKDTQGDGDHKCDNCDYVFANACAGGTAYCNKKTVCGECGQEYGNLNASNHATPNAVTYTNNGDTHSATYDCCSAAYVINETHTYKDGTCVCGAEEPVTDVAVTVRGTISYTVDGQVVTVTHSVACKVGYWDATNSKYVALTAAANGDGSYSFTAPNGVTEVLLVAKGDASGDGRVNTADKAQVNAAALRKTTLSAEAAFAADVTGDSRVNTADKAQVNAAALRKTTFEW